MKNPLNLSLEELQDFENLFDPATGDILVESDWESTTPAPVPPAESKDFVLAT